jgi:hypothetical protein
MWQSRPWCMNVLEMTSQLGHGLLHAKLMVQPPPRRWARVRIMANMMSQLPTLCHLQDPLA